MSIQCDSSPQRDSSGDRQRRTVLHVVESFGSGVQTALEGWIRATPQYKHVVLAANRQAPGSAVRSLHDVQLIELPNAHWRRMVTIRRVIKAQKPCIVHAHSSMAGAYVRCAPYSIGSPIAYSPHCFSFERRDISRFLRSTFWLAEALMSFRTASYLVVSEHEGRLTQRFPAKPSRHLVPVLPDSPEPARERHVPPNNLTVVAAGRIAPQKDPMLLVGVATQCLKLLPNLRFIWLGDGDEAYVRELALAGVSVSGWLPRSAALRELAQADIFLHTAAWEGSPLAIEEAMTLGVPVVARRLSVLEDRGLQRLGDSLEELAAMILDLASSQSLRIQASEAGVANAKQYRIEHQAALRAAYREIGG